MFVMIVASSSQPTPLPPMPNIGEYLGSGYDVMYGNPNAIDGKVDPGFRQSIFYLGKYNDPPNTTDDKRYQVPIGCEVRSARSCVLNFASTVLYDMQSYQHQLNVDANIDLRVWPASFSANADYQYIQHSIENESNLFVSSSASCQVYQSYLTTFDLPAFDPNFYNAIMQAPSEYEDEYYLEQIIGHFGTHVTIMIIMGGAYGQQNAFTSQSLQQLQSSNLSISLAASYSALMASGSASVLTQGQQQMAQQFQSAATSSHTFSVGGVTPTNGNTSLWIDSCIEEPMPVQYQLQTLSDFLTPEHFPRDPNITLKQQNMVTALSKYCVSLAAAANDSILCDQPTACQTFSQVTTVAPNGLIYFFDDCYSGYPCDRTASANIFCKQNASKQASHIGNSIDVGQTYLPTGVCTSTSALTCQTFEYIICC